MLPLRWWVLSRLESESMWWVGPGWTPGGPESRSITPLLSWTGERKYNKRIMGQDKGRGRSLSSYCHGQNRLSLGKMKLIYCQSNQSRVVRKENLNNTFPPPLPSSQAQLHSQFLNILPSSSTGGQGMGVMLSSSCVVSAAPSSSGGGLLTLFPCSSVGSLPRETVLHELLQLSPAYGVQSFRNRPLQFGTPMGSRPSSGIHLLLRGVLHGLQVDICSTVDLHGLQGHSLPHHGLLYGLQGNLCSGAWSTSYPLLLH